MAEQYHCDCQKTAAATLFIENFYKKKKKITKGYNGDHVSLHYSECTGTLQYCLVCHFLVSRQERPSKGL